jgi:transposase
MINYTLNNEELKIIQQAMNHSTQPEVRQRSTAIHLLHQQHKPKEVAGMMAVNIGSIYNWYRRWREEGIDGLKNRPKSGRPPNADDAYCQLLEELLANEPSDYGYAFAFWTANRLREHLRQKTGIKISNRRFRALMKKKDYVYRRPKHDLTDLQDPEAVDRAKELLEWVKKPVSTGNSNLSLWMKQQ